ncbi:MULTISPECIES: hypothetical protein [Paracoccus]|uniref:hypothetical protein n=1 Tax=Paracoccus TaxID=265 RepID=UPI000A8B6E39|nr:MULTISPECIES: hypothetical protein [Paracoccus]MBB4628877.1 hypothetical protein [Paracoccus denitrificans]MCU7430000.1 hypothetical protein [Paracoccus denitrificans]QAR26033.1 hypothetical protein EO213_06805 [Paracoccus denitrificans]UPV94946.1 hypothetical protein M0K93_14100 [Paracoccus denitrificans]WQO33000.1 hypothetical protein U0005_11820 [Paracoccus denitrificans]
MKTALALPGFTARAGVFSIALPARLQGRSQGITEKGIGSSGSLGSRCKAAPIPMIPLRSVMSPATIHDKF